jgi:uncharacterized protein
MTANQQPPSPSRLHVVDALRGFAIISIMLLHNLEHFDFYFTPEGLPSWMEAIDKVIWDTMFFLFGGKSYAIFAFLFGLTFFIQSDNQAKKGKDFRGRFAWRMVLLLGFGIVNSAFYQGDILTIYALIGFFLIPVAKLNNRTVLAIAIVLMLQPVDLARSAWALLNPGQAVSDPTSWSYFGKMGEYITGDSLWKTLWGNLSNGRPAVFLWTWENARVFQTLSLFMLGMLAGRKNLFAPSDATRKFWTKTLAVAAGSFCVLFFVNMHLGEWIADAALERAFGTAWRSWSNLAFMFVLVSGFTLLFQTNWAHRILNVFSPLGRMSLSNYMMQSIVGTFIYYGYGLGLYMYTGATYSLLIGIVLAVLQGWFSSWWMSRHKQGPLETLWHKGTWMKI